jgi:ABC-2 type transport system permease protein
MPTRSLLPFRALVLKDLRVFLSDRRAVTMSFVAPLILASLFAVIGGGAGDGDRSRGKIAILVADEDGTPLSKEVVKGLSGDPAVTVKTATREQARASIRSGDASTAVVIPAGFGERAAGGLFGGEKPALEVLSDPTHAAESGMVRGLLTQHVMQAVSRDAFTGPGGEKALAGSLARVEQSPDMPPAMRESLRRMFQDVRQVRQHSAALPDSGGYGGMGVPFTLREETLSAGGQINRGIFAAHAFAGMAVQFILFAAVEAGIALLLEREKGLWRRLRAAPLSRGTLLASRAVSQALIGLLITTVMFGVGTVIFRVRFSGSFGGFLLVAAAYALAASAFGLLVAAVGKTPQAARGVSVIVVLFMVLLGGAWMPSFMFPDWLQQITPVMPTRWAVDGFEGATWRGLSLAALLPKAGALLVFAALFGTIATLRFRWDTD